MTATNVSYYAAAFDATGKRVATKICDFNPLKNSKQRAALLDEVKACAASAAVVDIITSDDFIAYLDGKVRDSKTAVPLTTSRRNRPQKKRLPQKRHLLPLSTRLTRRRC